MSAHINNLILLKFKSFYKLKKSIEKSMQMVFFNWIFY